jgi:squalene synthase HpnC
MPPVNEPAFALAPAARHYENFPVASWLCPPGLRPAVTAIYWFARTADDIADEGDASAPTRLADLAAYRAELLACVQGHAALPRWAHVFGPLASALEDFSLPRSALEELLSAFEQDVVQTRDGSGYPDRPALLDYCRRSANPVGRLLLHLYGVHEPAVLAQSDCVCTALQLINFWQDLSVDLPRGRYYLPAQDCSEHGLDPSQPSTWPTHPHARRLIASEVDWARATMLAGAPLVRHVPGRAGWELRLVVQGGLRILDKIEATGFRTFVIRPRLRAWDLPLILWRSLWM